MIWINFLHIYQPPNQDEYILKEITEKSYSLISELLNKYSKSKLTLSFSGCLLEQLYEKGHKDILEKYKKLIANKKIELVGGAMYHPILPLLPEKEIKRQIDLNSEISLKIFGKHFKPKGFFLPEMAYNKKVAKIIKEKGFKWIILDEIHFPLKKIDSNVKYKIKDISLEVVFRNRKISNNFPPEYIIKNFEKISKTEKYIITAQDGEVYGYKHTDDRGFYKKIFTNKKINSLTVSEYLSKLKKEKEINPKKSSWETYPEDIKNKIYFPLWNHPKNKIHKLFWQMSKLAINSVEKKENDPEYFWARKHLDKGLSSCYLWWASNKDFKRFAPKAWDPTIVEKGAKELLSSIRSLKTLNSVKKLQFEELFSSIREELWNKHWKENK